jgi:predicted Zn finger-like uncharacterized protein
MRIDCPSCNAAYDVPEDRLVAGRAVKCARCAGMWTPVPALSPQQAREPGLTAAPVAEPRAGVEHDPDAAELPGILPAAAAVPEALPAPPAIAPLSSPAPARRRSKAPLAAAWLLTIAVLAGLGWAAFDRRAVIMEAWPPSIRVYAALGLVTPSADPPVTKP